MINKIRLKFGHTSEAQAEEINITHITVFVGPNNSGKSKILSELFQYCREGIKNAQDVILDEVTFAAIDTAEAEAAINNILLKPNFNETIQEGNILVGKFGERIQINYGVLVQAVKSPSTNHNSFCHYFLRYSTLMLNGMNRINLTHKQPAGDLQSPPQTSFQVLFKNREKRYEVRRIINDAFNLHFVIDPTELGQFKIRLSSNSPANELEECGIHTEAIQFHAAALPIERASDGVKAFTGIITEVIAGDPHIILIDEPEAFLHPALSYKLGLELSRAAAKSEKRVFISTHSSSYLMGCIQSGVPVNIVRLTYHSGIATARLLPSNEILNLMRNPLLRSTGVLNGLFYEYVVVTESDADRAFYQEINERLLRFKPEWGIPNCLFINAQNKQTIHTIINPLRKLGIPAAGIVDVDVVKEGGRSWTNLLSGANIPEINQQALSTFRGNIKKAMDDSGKDMKREGGINILKDENYEAAENLLRQLSEYGIFVVPGGELESWLKTLGATGHGPNWLIEMFEKMGEDAESLNYVRPENNDVWDFMKSVNEWLINPKRKGIPK
ncbi:MAG: ATP-dependent nuclease [Syntrophothermus sp.]